VLHETAKMGRMTYVQGGGRTTYGRPTTGALISPVMGGSQGKGQAH
jgi:hypothetical protein